MNPPAPTIAKTPKKVITDWIADYAAAHPEVTRDELVAAAREQFTADPLLHDALMEYAFNQLVPREAGKIMKAEGRIPMGATGWSTRDALAQRARDEWATWRERYVVITGDGHAVGLPDMTRSDLVEAVAARREVAREALVGVAFLSKLAGALTGDQRVRDVFTPEEIADAHASSQNLKAGR